MKKDETVFVNEFKETVGITFDALYKWLRTNGHPSIKASKKVIVNGVKKNKYLLSDIMAAVALRGDKNV